MWSPESTAPPTTTRLLCYTQQVAAAHPAVSIGSYPNTGTAEALEPYKVKLAFTSRDAAALDAAVEAARVTLRDVFDELPAVAVQ